MFSSITRNKASYLWNALAKIWPIFISGIGWSVGKGNMIKFWEDTWISDLGPLANHCQNATLINLNARVADMTNVFGGWDIDMLQNALSDQAVQRIKSVKPPSPLSTDDKMVWLWTYKGMFSLSSTYNNIMSSAFHGDSKMWDVVWKYKGPQRVRLFLWLVLKGKVLTNAERWRRGFASSDICPLCGTDPSQVLNKEISWATNTIDGLGTRKKREMERHMDITWTKPQMDWIKLNTDGAIATPMRLAGAGGVARDNQGNWLFGYNRCLGQCDPIDAELWGILDGLSIAWSWNIRNGIVECDNSNVVNWVNMNKRTTNSSILYDSIIDLYNRSWNVRIQHTYREANQVTDALAKRSSPTDTGFVVFSDIPTDLSILLNNDKARSFFKRFRVF